MSTITRTRYLKGADGKKFRADITFDMDHEGLTELCNRARRRGGKTEFANGAGAVKLTELPPDPV